MTRCLRPLALGAVMTLVAAPALAVGCNLWLQFGFGSAEIRPDGRALLDKVARLYPSASYEIFGHADAPGSEFRNLVISRRRAEAVAAYLAARGVAGVVSLEALAQTDLLVAEHGPKKTNRRVEIYVSPCSEAVLIAAS